MPASVAVFGSDDGYDTTRTIMMPTLAAAGLVGVLHTHFYRLGKEPAIISWSGIAELDAGGWLVASHGWSGGDPREMTDAELFEHLHRPRQLLLARGYAQGSRHYGPPGDWMDSRVAAAALAAGYQTLRSEQSGAVAPAGYTWAIQGIADQQSWSTVQAAIDAAVAAPGTILCLVAHEMCESTPAPAGYTSVERLQAVMAAAAAAGLEAVRPDALMPAVTRNRVGVVA